MTHHYQYGVRYYPDDGRVRMVSSDYDEVRTFVDGWNTNPGNTSRAEVVVRKVVTYPWVSHPESFIRRLIRALARY